MLGRGWAIAAGIIALLLCGVLPAGAAALTLTADPFLQQGSKLVDSEMSEHTELGSSVAISADGDTALVGGEFYDSGAGAAWVFTRSGSTWTQQAKLVGKEASALAHQGFSVALSADGDTALIGGPQDEGASKTFPGAAWVFTRSGSTWTEQAKLVGTGASTPSGQGQGVALSADGDTALIGGYLDGGGVGAGWVFIRSGSTWAQQGNKLVGKPGTGLVEQGSSVALSGDGDTALLGGPRAEGEKGEPEAGAAWAFTRSGTVWTEQERLLAGKGAGERTGQGESVALSDDGATALVGGAGDNGEVGAAWVFTRTPEPGDEPTPEPEPEPSPKPEGKGSTGNGSGGSGGTSSNSSGNTPGGSLGIASSAPGIATTPQAVEELLLGCSKHPLVLNDVLIDGDRVALEGSAAKGLDGKRGSRSSSTGAGRLRPRPWGRMASSRPQRRCPRRACATATTRAIRRCRAGSARSI